MLGSGGRLVDSSPDLFWPAALPIARCSDRYPSGILYSLDDLSHRRSSLTLLCWTHSRASCGECDCALEYDRVFVGSGGSLSFLPYRLCTLADCGRAGNIL